MHHSEELPDEIKGLRDEMAERLGATGKFPDGKIHETDKGEIQFGIAGDEERELVHLDFGEKPIAYVSMKPDEAVAVAQALIRHARKVSKTPITITIH